LQQQVQCALDAIHGVDINPFAVAIARFRLTVRAPPTMTSDQKSFSLTA
jgi:hypothetical protein